MLHSDLHHETLVSSSGGGGYVGPNGGHVAAAQISSATVEHQTFFARDDDGVESRFQWSDWTLPVRPGSRLAVIWGARTGSATGPYFGAINLDTKEERWSFDSWFQAEGLVTARVRGWLCFLAALLVAGALTFGVAYRELSERPRPEQLAFDDARMAVGVAINDLEIARTGRTTIGTYAKPTAPGSPQRVALAKEEEREALGALRLASTVPPPQPTVRKVFSLATGDTLYQVGFAMGLAVVFIALFTVNAFVVAFGSARSGEDRRTEDRLRQYLRTGNLPSA